MSMGYDRGMDSRLTTLAAHGQPQDEMIHVSGTLGRYAADGAHDACVTATRGELVDRALATPPS
jgi:LmbE family N-acetylglucosaminyl deacetylase